MGAQNSIEIVIKATDSASGVLQSILGDLGSFGETAASMLAVGTTAALALGGAMFELAREAAPVANIRDAFDQLASSVSGGADAMLNSLQSASGGMIDQATLMRDFNQASLELGNTLADKLPSAMRALQPIAAATGGDLGAMTDSFMQSIEALQPRALKQMGIILDMTQVYADYAKSIGTTADKLTTAQKQTAMMNAALSALQGRAAQLPDVTNSAAASWSRFGAQLSNIKDQIGEAFLPAFQSIVTVAGQTIGFLQDAFSALGSGTPFMSVFAEFLNNLAVNGIIPQQLADGLMNLASKIDNIITPIANWISQNVQLNDVLTAIGLIVASVVIPAIAGVVISALPVIAIFAAIVGAVVLLRRAWESDFGGIREIAANVSNGISRAFEVVRSAITLFQDIFASSGDAVYSAITTIGYSIPNLLENLGLITPDQFVQLQAGIENALFSVRDFIMNQFIPAVEVVVAWLQVNIPIAVQTASDFWTNTLQAALAAVGAFITGTVIPAIQSVIQWLQTNIPVAIQAAAGFWTNTLHPALEKVGSFITTSVIPAIEKIVAWLQVNIPIAVQAASNFWQTVLLPALQKVGDFITGTVIPAVQKVVDWLQTNIPIAVQKASDFWTNTLQPALQKVGDFITGSVIPAVQKIVDWLQTNIPVAVQAATDVWNNLLYPAIQKIWQFIDGSLRPVFESLVNLGIAVVNLALTELARVWNEVLKPALDKAWSFIQDNIIPIFNKVGDTVTKLTGGPLNVLQGILDAVSKVFGDIKTAIDSVTKGITDFTNSIGGIQLPSFLTPGSPTPFEMGLRGIHDALLDISGLSLPSFNAGLSVSGTGAGAGAGGSATHIGSFQMIFNGGPGAPRNDEEASTASQLLVNALRARGVSI
jgi:hypothetical protein